MITFPRLFLLATALLLAFAAPDSPAAARKKGHAAGSAAAASIVNPAYFAMLGSGAPPDRVERLSSLFRVSAQPGQDGTPRTEPLFSVLQRVGDPQTPRFEAADIEVEMVTAEFGVVKVEHANVALTPSADGTSCAFEVSGAPFGGAARLEAKGKVVWAGSPGGGDNLDISYRLDAVAVESLREIAPDRFDSSIRGLLALSGKASGVVGETTTEAAPAAPLRGDLEARMDWEVFGRTGPLTMNVSFSLDDRMVRIRKGRMEWEKLGLDIRGWFNLSDQSKFELKGEFKDVDTKAVAQDWNVAPAWQPESTLSGTVAFTGGRDHGSLRYDVSAPELIVPALGGYTIRATTAKITGNLAAVNAEVSASLSAPEVQIGDLKFPAFPIGLQYFNERLSVSTSNSTLWGGDNSGTISYKPAEHPAWSLSGNLTGANGKEMVAVLAPWLGLELDGTGAVAYSIGQDAEKKPRFTVHGSLLHGRIENVNFFARVLDGLAAIDPALALGNTDEVVPQPRNGTGTKVDAFFFEAAKSGGPFDLGAMVLESGGFLFEADGRYGPSSEIALAGTVSVPEDVVARLVASAPWLAALRSVAAKLVVPVVVGGTTANPTVAPTAQYAELLARAKKGESVTAPEFARTRHVGDDNLSTIPGNPKNLENW